MIAAGSAAGPAVYLWVFGTGAGGLSDTFGAGVLSSVLYVSVARSAGLYRLPALIEPGSHIRRILAVCSVVLLSLTAVIFLLKIGPTFSRGAVLGFAAFMLLQCVLTRFAAAAVIGDLIARGAIAGRPVFLLGEGDELETLAPDYLLRQFGLQEIGRYRLGDLTSAPAVIDDALAAARAVAARALVVVARLDSLDRLHELEHALRATPLPVKLLPNHVFRSVIGRQASNHEAGVHLIDLQRAPMSVSEQLAKRCLDVALASVAIAVLSPLLLMVALIVRLDSKGPVIFKQRRNGFDQRQFVIYKFRTMTVMEDGERVIQAQRNDRRITRIGRILRRTSIDELPQLFNVLRGDMSLVGPRPHALAHDHEYKTVISDYCMRHHMKPGMTGWAQVNGLRGETARTEDMRRRVDLDVWYVTNWSLLFDLHIIIRTCFEVVRHEAY